MCPSCMYDIEIEQNRIESNGIEQNRMEWNRIEQNEMEQNRIELEQNRIESNGIEQNRMKWNRIELEKNRIDWIQIRLRLGQVRLDVRQMDRQIDRGRSKFCCPKVALGSALGEPCVNLARPQSRLRF